MVRKNRASLVPSDEIDNSGGVETHHDRLQRSRLDCDQLKFILLDRAGAFFIQGLDLGMKELDQPERRMGRSIRHIIRPTHIPLRL